MNAQDLTQNIAVNLGRLARFASEGNKNRLSQFITDTEEYIVQLDNTPKSNQFNKTYLKFKNNFTNLKNNIHCNNE